jgi:hypothetical protein
MRRSGMRRSGRRILVRKRAKRLRGVGAKALIMAACAVLFAASFAGLSWYFRFKGVERLRSDALFAVIDLSTKRMGYMDAHGDIVIDAVYIHASEFVGEYAVVIKDVGGRLKEGMIDHAGRIVFEFRYEQLMYDARNGMVIVVEHVEDEGSPTGVVKRYGYCGVDGRVLISPQFDYAAPFAGEHAFALMAGEWHVIDRLGQSVKRLEGVSLILCDEGADDAPVPYTRKGSDYATSVSPGAWGYLDRAGETVIPELYAWAGHFEGGRAMVVMEDGGLARIIDSSGKVIQTLGDYEFARGFRDGVAVGVHATGGFGAVDKKGRAVIEPVYVSVGYGDGVLTAEVAADHFIFFNGRGGKLLEWRYPCADFGRGAIFYQKEGRIYLMDVYGRTRAEVPKGYAPFCGGWAAKVLTGSIDQP